MASPKLGWKMGKTSLCALLLELCAGCGGGQAPAKAPDTGEAEATAPAGDGAGADAADADSEGEAEPEQAGALPTKCHKAADPCVPPPKFVEGLCSDTYAAVALHMFLPSAPWKKAYLRGKTKAWNASGGVSDNEAYLEFDEEVVLLKKRGGPGGIQVSGAEGGYDALRWDGSCVTLDASEVTLTAPPQPKAAKVEWRFLDEPTQNALRESETVVEAYRTRRKECKGAVSGTVSKKCVVADDALSQKIVDHVRSGGALGTPERMP
ncbi:MAG TPA: hypothetical protein VI197_24965 [Polyangiaceae bacterium]